MSGNLPARRRMLVQLVAFLGLLVGLSTPALAAPYETVAPGTLLPGDAIPPAEGRIVLIVNGAAREGKALGPLRFDITTLEKIGLIRYTANNRWYNDPPTFEGILGSAFLDVVGVPKDATIMKMRALNDYLTRIPIADFRRWPVMLALKMNGKYMPVRSKGPIWIVYPSHLDEALRYPPHQGKWIWQLAEITFQ